MGSHEHGWWILLHVVLFVFWLGGDLGVFWSSRYVLRSELTPAARHTALQIMLGLDLAPRVCLVLFLPSGVTLMALEPHGADVFTWWNVTLVWLFALLWLALTVHEHVRHGSRPLVPRVDRWIRFAVVGAMFAAGLYTVAAHEPFGVTTDPRWLGAKVMLYATAIACGLGIRMRLRPFGPAFAELMSKGSNIDVERRLERSIEGCLPFVFGIWISILAAAALGILKPGAHL
ncbi:hypothetical protein B4N89_00695 [Embleya scabrispora]|uniref:Copper resistance protein D domain-containing protein n=1 Tax=Embleya scabrispora TaxID=159449 RepID=A0A1T3NS79_9ACTN|nr:hypothetical protein [Embleya scabrispora]OPC79658.1 hypothetical protein B4N89_00695 [Embleya scabrispora]